MEIREISEELCRLHLVYAGLLSKATDLMALRGKSGILMWLAKNGEDVCSVDICRHFSLTAGRVANILRELEQQKLVERTQDTEDLRRMHVRLTEKGKLAADGMYAEMVEQHTDMLERIGQEDAEALLRLAGRIVQTGCLG